MKIIQDARALAISEISTYGLPHELHFEISEKKALELAEKLKADKMIVHLGVCFMDLKLGQAKLEQTSKEDRVNQHIEMGVAAAKEFLKKYKLDKKTEEKIINCIEAHHGTTPFRCIEAEICANADCYRFLTPRGFFLYLTMLGKRGLSFEECMKQTEMKMEEKWGVLTLGMCKGELGEDYKTLKRFLKETKSL